MVRGRQGDDGDEVVRSTVRLFGDLEDLAGGREHEVPVGARRSVKDLVESLGVPHTEFGVVAIDGVAVGHDHLVDGAVHVSVYPAGAALAGAIAPAEAAPSRAATAPERFVLDVHLGTLTRRLRLLGFDCWYSTSADDPQLARIAHEGIAAADAAAHPTPGAAGPRVLLTRDRQLLMRREVVHGYLPRSDDPETQAIEVLRRFDLARRVAPFTRCVPCNGHLEVVERAEVEHELPPRTREAFTDFARCRSCGQIYWPGSHLEAVEGFLDRVEAEG